jgi:hypothetical protein
MGTGITVALDLLFGLLDRAQAIGKMITDARASGRDLTEADLNSLVASDDQARIALVKAISDARAATKVS